MKLKKRDFFMVLMLLGILNTMAISQEAPPTEPSPVQQLAAPGIRAVVPNSFTGSMSYSIPIEVPVGRRGMQPQLSLIYSSGSGNGWLGVGWNLEVGAIERNTKRGIKYNDEDDYILILPDSAIDLVPITVDEFGVTVNNEYRAKIEGAFYRIRKLTASDSRPYWEVTDRTGMKYIYGYTIVSEEAITRQYDSADPNKIFRWCLESVQDTNGNYMAFSYFKEPRANLSGPDRLYRKHGRDSDYKLCKILLGIA